MDHICSSQKSCELNSRLVCEAPKMPCCVGLSTGINHKGTYFVFESGTCTCCEDCEVIEPKQPIMVTVVNEASVREPAN